MNHEKRIVLAGGSGFLGTMLAKHFAASGRDVLVLTRHPRSASGDARQAAWDGATRGPWAALLEGADAVINLAGRSVDCRYHARNRGAIMDSRVNSTRVLGEAISRCARPPRVWLNSSTATIYKHSFDTPMDEAGEIGATREAKDAFSIEVAIAWEREFAQAVTPHTRKVALRTAMVLGAGGGVFAVLRRLVRAGLGGRMAGGNQYVSWIHETDFCRAIDWLLESEDLDGTINVAAPNPLPNREMMRTFREVCGIPFGIPTPTWMLELGAIFLRTETELIIKSRRVVPGRLTASGFAFRLPQFRGAIQDLMSKPPA
jgi:uncharacterized protein